MNPIGVIIEEIASHHKLSPGELLKGRRLKHIVVARHEAMWTARHLLKSSFPQIARAFRMQDHTTVIYAVRKIAGDPKHAKRRQQMRVAAALWNRKTGEPQ